MNRSEAAKLARENVEPPWDELRAARVQKRVLEGMRAPTASEIPRVSYVPRAFWVVAAISAVAAALLFFVLRTSPLGEAKVTASRIDLADGSFALLDEGARVVPEMVVDNRVELRQFEGSATYDVVPGRSRKFSVLVDDVRIDVLGTSFRVEKLDGGLRVAVVRGKVQVTRAERSVVLAAGEELTWREDAPETESTLVAPATPDRATPIPTPAVSVPIEEPTVKSADAPSSARTAAAEEPVGPSAADLFRKADDARASGNQAEAVRLLEELIAKHPKDSRVTLATFTIGRLEMQRGNAAKAAAAFESCGQALNGEALAEAALARSRAGQGGAAQALATRYLQLFPEGARAKEMARLAP